MYLEFRDDLPWLQQVWAEEEGVNLWLRRTHFMLTLIMAERGLAIVVGKRVIFREIVLEAVTPLVGVEGVPPQVVVTETVEIDQLQFIKSSIAPITKKMMLEDVILTIVGF